MGKTRRTPQQRRGQSQPRKGGQSDRRPARGEQREQRRTRPSPEEMRRRGMPARSSRPGRQPPPHAVPPGSRPPRPADRPPRREQPRKRRRPVDAALRRKRRRRMMALFYLLLFLVVIGTALTLCLTVLFRVESIEVKGESRYSAEEILEASGLETGGNLFLTDTESASDAVERKLPYIGTADVRRVLPSVLEIDVSEEQVAGVILDDAQYILVGVSGKVLDRLTERPEGYPMVKGMAVQSAAIGTQITYEDSEKTGVFDKLMQAIAAVGLEKVTEIDLTDTYSTTVLYDDRILLKLGTPTSFQEKLQTFLTLLQQGNLTDTDRGTLDLSLVADIDRSFFREDFSDPVSSSAGDASVSSGGETASGSDASAASPDSAAPSSAAG